MPDNGRRFAPGPGGRRRIVHLRFMHSEIYIKNHKLIQVQSNPDRNQLILKAREMTVYACPGRTEIRHTPSTEPTSRPFCDLATRWIRDDTLRKFMILTIEQFPEFISVTIEKQGDSDKRVMLVRSGEDFTYDSLKMSYLELRYGPRVINLCGN